MPKELSKALILEWLQYAQETFSVENIWQEMGIITPSGKDTLRKILWRLENDDHIISSLGGHRYRKVNYVVEEVDWQSADENSEVNLKFPFELEKLCKVYTKSIIIVAGSTNAGKTALLYNFIALNMHTYAIDLYNSETSPEQMKARFAPLNIPNPAPFKVYQRYDQFADVIKPDHISVIDYLDVNAEFYLVGAEIDKIFRKLTSGVAVIALQKPPAQVSLYKGEKQTLDRDLGYGGGVTAKRAALYLSLSYNKLKLVKVKTPRNPRINPNNKQYIFSLEDGIRFTNIYDGVE